MRNWNFMTKRNTTNWLLTLATACMLAGLALADTVIHAEFTADYDRIRPDPYRGIHLKNSLDVTLSGLNKVDEKNTRETGPMADQFKGQRILGQTGDGGSSWRVGGPDQLERTVEWPQST